MNPLITIGKKCFYRFFPSAHVSAYIRTLYLKRHVRHFNFSHTLDAGCGTGLFTLFLAEKFPQAQFVGYDISRDDILQCDKEAGRKGFRNVSFRVQNLIELDEYERYDFIFSIDCLEHIPGNQKVIANLVKALASGGILYLAIPGEKNHRYLFPKRYFERYTQWASGEHIGDQYTRDELVAVFRALQLDILHAQYTFGFWGKLAWELDMLTDGKPGLKTMLLPLLFCIGALDPFFSNNSGPYGVLVIGKKPRE
jgi:2-polyprenyl-3-methyl-5-hydroxy-6-metoxy-1,4-benzoquinol methylase